MFRTNTELSYKYGFFVFHNSVKISFYASEKCKKDTEKNEIRTSVSIQAISCRGEKTKRENQSVK